MHFRGTYQKTLARILSAVAIIMALLISVLSGAFLERQTHAEYEYHLEQTAKSQESSATIASNVILNTVLKCASNQSIIRWVNSSSLPEYYFNAIGATKGLQESINNTLPIEYQCALMPLSVKAFNGKIVDMVLTHNRTIAVSELLSTLHIDQQEYLRLIDHFYDSDEPYFLARYDQESQDLENMIYIMKANNTKNTKNAFLIFVTIPRETFVAASWRTKQISSFYTTAQGSSPIPITQRSFRSTASRSTKSFQFQKVLFIMAKPRILLADTYWSPESHLFSG